MLLFQNKKPLQLSHNQYFMKNLFFIFFLFLSQNILAQADDNIYDSNSYPEKLVFPEGKDSLLRWAQREISYPVDAENSGEKVHFSIQFIIEKDGAITEIETWGKDSVFFKAEITRFVKSFKKWIPTQIAGKSVRCSRILDIYFENAAVKVSEGVPQEIFQVVEQQAEFPDGQKALFDWIEENLEYPNDNDVNGKTILRFVVEKNGRISNITVLRSFLPEYDTEAVLCVQKMPRWKPGKQRGNPVRSYFTLPVVFK
jgi:TonB family protein